jgi:hypothetical protein
VNRHLAQIIVALIPLRKWRRKAYDWLMRNTSNGKSLRDAALNYSMVEFIIENFTNSAYFETMHELYNFFHSAQQYSFHAIFQKRITKRDEILPSRMTAYTDKEIVIISDSDFAPKNYRRINISEIPFISDKDKYAFLVVFDQDFLAREAVKVLTDNGCKYYVPPKHQYVTRYFNTDKDAFETLLDESKLDGMFCPPDFENIFQALAATRDLSGAYVEVGVFQGASAHAALNYMQRAGIKRQSYFLDTYEGFTYEEAKKSEDPVWVNSHQDTSLERISDYLSLYPNTYVIKNNIISDTFPIDIKEIAVANLDVDMYEAVKAGLRILSPLIVKNGILIVEDYGHTPSLIGAQKAVHEFLDEFYGEFTPLYMASGQMFLVKR